MVHEMVFAECIKNGYSKENSHRIWDIASHDLLYVTPQLAEGFLNLKKFGRYKVNVIDREIGLVKKHAPKFLATFQEPFNLIDLGSGDGTKSAALIKSLPKHVRLRYCPVDINRQFVDMSVSGIESLRSPTVSSIKPVVDKIQNLADIAGMLRNSQYQKNVSLLFGSTLASFEINDFLFGLTKDMFRNDVLIIGNGIREGKRFVGLQKYKHPAFNSWFIHLVKGLGFEENEVEYDVRFANSRLEFFYRVLVDKKIEHENKRISFRKGDIILVAYQYKYFAKELEKFCKMYFSKVELVKDPASEYALVFCTK